MKHHLCLFALLALGSPLHADDAVSEEVAALGMLPTQRTGVRINADERNPFALKPKEIAKAVAEDTETQESKIRSVFRQLRVTGVRRDRSGRSLALAGDLILRQGEEVPPVLEDQTEILIVSKIEPQQIELTFVEDKDSTQPRVIVLPVRNQVQVAQKLFGQPKGKASLYIAHGRSAPDLEETAAAIAAAPPTAPASATPVATATGAQPPAAAPRDPRLEAAALAGHSEPALAALVGGSPSGTTGSSAPSAPAAPPEGAAAAAPAEEASAPTFNRRRTTPPPGPEQPPPPPGTSILE